MFCIWRPHGELELETAEDERMRGRREERKEGEEREALQGGRVFRRRE